MLQTPSEYVSQFRACVLKHINDQLPHEEWLWLRNQCEAQVSGFMPNLPVDPFDIDASPEQLVAKHIFEDSLRVIDVLEVFEGKAIDEIAGQPVYYCPKTGIYLWGRTPEHDFSLSFWITHPASPPGW